ncbi:MAG: aminotransferase class I/II-fold pyridoxal phosphate-dependent enzyme [Mogibacterium sp.]|nr:aminotransferase class I/II-fold pyridoxal phosphate-dependent enzyme [Mogibacterium sp.]
MKDHLNTAVYSAKRSAIREFSKLAAATPDCIQLTLGEPDFDTPEVICRAASEALEAGETHYIENNGILALREGIAAFEREQNGMDYTADEVIVTAGATEALFISLFGILNPGDEVIIPSPAFVLYEQIVNLCRGVTVPMDTVQDGFQIRRPSLQPLITERTKAIILNTPNNPTGCVYDEESLRTVYEAVRGRNIFVICDDVYRQLCYTEDYHSFAEFRDLREQLLVVQSFSKPYAMTGWRVGWLLADASVKERLELIHQFMVVSAPAPFQQACITALGTDPAEMTGEYRKRRDYVTGRLEEMGLPAVTPEGAFYAFPSIEKYGLGSEEFCTRLVREAGVAVTPGMAFGSDRHIRISYCCSRRNLREGLDRLERFLGTI